MAERNGAFEVSEDMMDETDETEISADTTVELTAEGLDALRMLHRSDD